MKNPFSVKISIRYGTIIGTIIVLAGIVHLFISQDALGAASVIAIGIGAILGRAWMQQRCNHADPAS